MSKYSQHASFYRAALLLGLVSGESVVLWADSIIASDADAPAGVLNLAMIAPADLSELRHALLPLAASVESLDVVRALLAITQRDYSSKRRDTKDTITVIRQTRSFLPLPADYYDEIGTLQNDHMLATANVIGDVNEVGIRLEHWLAQFAGAELIFLKENVCQDG
ncbi:MAG: hypothetical protein ABJC26_04135 [Gemmatimonadaceae bacterium]